LYDCARKRDTYKVELGFLGLFELGMKELQGMKEMYVGFLVKNNRFTSLISSNSFIPNSNKPKNPNSETITINPSSPKL
jgi:hypothetical protein